MFFLKKEKISKNKKRGKPPKATYDLKATLIKLGRYTVFSFAVLALGFALYQGSVQVNRFLDRPITDVMVTGDFNYMSQEQVRAIAESYIENSFMKEKLPKLSEQLEQLPWVDRVALKRQWPSTLEVMVVEQKPIARWSDGGFVNHRGQVVALKNIEKIKHLPVLSGSVVESAQIMQQYSTLAHLLKAHGLHIYLLEKTPLGVWQMSLSNEWKIILGRNDAVRKLKTLTRLLQQQTLIASENIELIDMRYESGFAVSWKDETSHLLSAVTEN